MLATVTPADYGASAPYGLHSSVCLRRSIEDESVFAVILTARSNVSLTGDAVDAAQLPKKNALRIVRISKSVIRPRQLLLRDRAHNIGG